MRKLIISFFLTAISLNCIAAGDIADLRQKAKAGDTEAQYRLATAYDSGQGVRRSGRKAKKWYLIAANRGHLESQNSIGSIFQAEKNYRKAFEWYKKAAAESHLVALSNLGYLYDQGFGIEQSRIKAEELYIASANLGWADAMFNLANLYGAGFLGETDLVQAYAWCSRCSKYSQSQNTTKRAAECILYLNQNMSEQEIEHAREIASNWSPNK